jgi:DNA adenine methylase
MGFSGAGALRESPTGFRAVCNKARTPPPAVFRGYPAGLATIIGRLQGVVIENRPAMAVMRAADSPLTLHYVDPPYSPETRDAGGDYRHEMSAGDHLELATFLKTLKGMVMLSGYNSPAYEREYADWHKVEHRADHPKKGLTKRTEVLWMRNIEQSEGLFARAGNNRPGEG